MACHLAVTPAGRRALEGSGCLPRWLARWQKLPPQQRLMLLMLPLACMTDWTQEAYFQPLFRKGEWVRATISVDADSYKAYDKTQVSAAIRRQVGSRSKQQRSQSPPQSCARCAHGHTAALNALIAGRAVTAAALTGPLTSHAQQCSQSQSRFQLDQAPLESS